MHRFEQPADHCGGWQARNFANGLFLNGTSF